MVRLYSDSHDEEFQTLMNEFNDAHGLNIPDLKLTDKKTVRKICEFDNVPITLEQYLAENNLGEVDVSSTIEDSHSDSYDWVQIVPGIYDMTIY